MTVITYSSAAGRIEKKIQVLEDSSSSGNVPEPLSESPGPRIMLDHFENQILESCEVKGRRRTDEEDQKPEEEVAGGNLQRRRQQWGRGVDEERVKTGQREAARMRNRNCPKGNRKNKGEEKEQSSTDGLKSLSPGETRGEIKQCEKRTRRRTQLPARVCASLPPNASREGRNMATGGRQTFLWIALLILSLCPNPASSQVRVALKSHFFLIRGCGGRIVNAVTPGFR